MRKRTAFAESRDGLFIDEKISFRASSVPRGSRGDGGRGGGAGARAKRASGDGCARVADTSCASPRGRARDDARACASRPPRATPEKNRGTETSCAPNDVGTVGDRGISRGVFFPVSNGAMPPERKRDVEGVPSCAWVTTADPRRRSRPCRSSRGRGRIETSVEESRMWETACRLLLRVRCLFFSLLGLRKASAGARGALRTRAPATRDARRMSISIGPASRADTRLARRALGHVFKEDFLAGLLSREKIQVKAQKRAREIRHLTV